MNCHVFHRMEALEVEKNRRKENRRLPEGAKLVWMRIVVPGSSRKVSLSLSKMQKVNSHRFKKRTKDSNPCIFMNPKTKI